MWHPVPLNIEVRVVGPSATPLLVTISPTSQKKGVFYPTRVSHCKCQSSSVHNISFIQYQSSPIRHFQCTGFDLAGRMLAGGARQALEGLACTIPLSGACYSSDRYISLHTLIVIHASVLHLRELDPVCVLHWQDFTCSYSSWTAWTCSSQLRPQVCLADGHGLMIFRLLQVLAHACNPIIEVSLV